MELKELIGEELFKQVESKLGENSVIVTGKDEKYIKDDGSFVPKSRFNEVIEQKNTYKESVDDYKKQLDSLKTQLKGNEEITKQIDELQEQLSKKDAEVLGITKQYSLKDSLKIAGAKYPDLLMTKFTLADLIIEDGKIKGIDESIKKVKESYPDLFGEIIIAGSDDGRIPDPLKVQLTETQRKEALEKFPYMTKEKAEESWFDVLKSIGKIK